jgi:uncharacterized protein (DUF697 family)
MSDTTTGDLVPTVHDAEEEKRAPSSTALASVVTYSVMGGLCPLIPVPFIDDIILSVIRKRMVASLCQAHQLSPSKAAIKALSKEKSGCALGCLFSVVAYPVKKILKKVFFFLSIKGAVDTTSTMLHRGYLLNHCLVSGVLNAATLEDQASLLRVQTSIVTACDHVDPRPINQILKRVFGASRALLSGAARNLWALFRKERVTSANREESAARAMDKAEVEETSELRTILQEIRQEVWAQEGYLEDLVATFDTEFSKTPNQS